MIRYMGSKSRLLPWIHEILSEVVFDSVVDAFSGSGCVSYLFKAMGKKVTSSDFLQCAATLAKATVENPGITITADDRALLLSYDPSHRRFIEKTFDGIFYTSNDLRFLDRTCWNLRKLSDPYKRAMATAALIRSCVKRQPRGVFTVAGDPEKYKDGRRDLRLSIHEHFEEQLDVYNMATFDNGRENVALHGDVFDIDPTGVDLVYFDPPYVPRSDDNCYVKRYHFLEGLSCYWEGADIMQSSRVKKLEKRFTPFSYRRTAIDAFDRMFQRFRDSTIVLSYSSNGFPDLDTLRDLLRRYKPSVRVHERPHRYHFGTHKNVLRNEVTEYLVVGQ